MSASTTAEAGRRKFLVVVDDTPECRDGFPDGCPDLGNLMFPLARSQNAGLSPLQISVVRANPLSKE